MCARPPGQGQEQPEPSSGQDRAQPSLEVPEPAQALRETAKKSVRAETQVWVYHTESGYFKPLWHGLLSLAAEQCRTLQLLEL